MGTKYKEGKREEPTPEKRKFDIPSNVRQIGGVTKGTKIFIEDYAYSYIQKLGKRGTGRETAVFLVGYLAENEGESILAISGAIKPPFAEPGRDGQIFSSSDFAFGEDMLEKYFKGLQIVGWARVQPGYGLYLSATDISNHYLCFTDKHAVLFLADTEEKLDCFFKWNENQDDLEEVSGYFIYYDKNSGMNEYITEMKGEALRADIAAKKAAALDSLPDAADSKIIADSAEYEAAEISPRLIEDENTEPKTISRSVDKAKRIAEISRQKRIISMMTSVSMLLFFACVIMGVGLLQSGERISDIEGQMRELRTGYNSLVSKLNDSAYPAFAAQSSSMEQEPDITKEIDEILTANAVESQPTAEQSLDEALGIVPITEEAQQQTQSVSTTPQEQQPQEQQQEQQQEQPPQSQEEAQASVPIEPEAAAEPLITKYIVKTGDTLSYISEKFYGSVHNVDKIMDANGILDAKRLRPGMELIIPD